MNNFKNPTHQIGVTLVEILVTVVIIAIGLLGLAVMQNISVKASYDSYLRTQASFLAYDIFDRIRANPSGGVYALDAGDTPTTANCFGAGANCDAATMRTFDLFYWHQNAEELLPDATISLALNGNIYTANFTWDDRADNDEISTAETTAGKEFSYHYQIQ